MRRLSGFPRRTLLLVVLAVVFPGCRPDPMERKPLQTHEVPPSPVTFQGASTDLERSVVVPTLDTPMPPGKNVIWCGSFQEAWNKLKEDVVKEPVELDRAADLADRLNRAQFTADDLPPGAYYCAAGFLKDGIADEIRSQMQRRFGKAPEIEFEPTSGGGATVYAYLRAGVKFGIPFFAGSKPLAFTPSEGPSVPVTSFGIREEDEYAYFPLREQVEVLYAWTRGDAGFGEQDEFAIDPCKTSSPNQLVIARVPPRGTLDETLRSVREKTAWHPQAEYLRGIGPNEHVLIPVMNWEIEHEFPKLKNAHFLNEQLAGLFIEAARQSVRFRLDQGGAELESEAAMPMAPVPRHFYVKGPFLVYLKRRDREQPFFVMWVDNAELLVKP